MPIGPIGHGKFKIENQSDADVCLRELFKEPEYRSMDEVYTRLMPDVEGEELEQYVFNKAKEMLKDIYGIEVK
jgi:hypothetical protein